MCSLTSSQGEGSKKRVVLTNSFEHPSNDQLTGIRPSGLLDVSRHVVAAWETNCLCGSTRVWRLLYTSHLPGLYLPNTPGPLLHHLSPWLLRPLGRTQVDPLASLALFLTSPPLTDGPPPDGLLTHHFCHGKFPNMSKVFRPISCLTKNKFPTICRRDSHFHKCCKINNVECIENLFPSKRCRSISILKGGYHWFFFIFS